MITIIQVSKKLMELSEQYALILPQYHLAELAYTNKKAKILMSQEIMGLGSQPLRDAECLRVMEQTPEYEAYQKLLPEKMVIDVQLRVYQQLSKNLIAVSWGGSETNG